MVIRNHRDAAHTASRSAVCVPSSVSSISQGLSLDEAEDQRLAQSGCISRYTVMAIEQQQRVTVAVQAAWADSPLSDAITITRLFLRSEELPGESYFACLGADAIMFLEAATIAIFFDVDEDE